jgi:hypothetical protein
MNALVDNGCWANDFAKIVWIRGLLEDDAAAMAHGWFEEYIKKVAAGELLKSQGWVDMWEMLDKFFINHFDQTRRLAEYRKVKQGNRPHAEYFQEWESKRSAAGVNPDTPSLLADYMIGMNDKLREHVQGHVDSEERSWQGHLNLIQRMAEGWESNHSYSNSNGNSNSNRNRSWQPRPSGQQQQQPRTTSQGGDAMDIDKAPLWTGKRAKWVNQNEIDRRRQYQLCIRCGGNNHRIRDCPLAPATRPQQARIAVGSTPAAPAGSWEEDEPEQGKAQL